MSTLSVLILCTLVSHNVALKFISRSGGLYEFPIDQMSTDTTKVMVSNNNFTSIRANTFRNFHQIWLIYLYRNEISFISSQAFDGTILKVLSLHGNRLRSLPSFNGVKNTLNSFIADFNIIERLDREVFQNFSKLYNVNLGNNRLSFIDDDAFSGTVLRTLDVSSNRLKRLPSFSIVRSSLREIYARQNAIETLDSHVFQHCIELSYVDLHGNFLLFIADDAFSGTFLSSIDLSNNRLRALPSFTNTKASLRCIDAHHNEIEMLGRGAFNGCGRLQRVYLQHNVFSYLPPDAFNGTILSTLDISNNRLKTAPILHTTPLSILRLQDNAISEISDVAFEGMNLTLLDLSNNRLRYLPNVFPLNASIETLDLSNNQIGPVASDIILQLLQTSSRLKYIDLRNIGLETIPDIRLLQRTIAYVFMLNPGSMRCDCSIKWMTDFIKQPANITSLTDITPYSTPCASPVGLVGRELDTITYDDICKPITATTTDATQQTSSAIDQLTKKAVMATTTDVIQGTPTATDQITKKGVTATTTDVSQGTPPATAQLTIKEDSGQVTAVGASLGTLLLLAILLIVFLVYRHVLQRPLALAASKTTEREDGSSNEPYASIEIAQISKPENNIYAELQVTERQSEIDPCSMYENSKPRLDI